MEIQVEHGSESGNGMDPEALELCVLHYASEGAKDALTTTAHPVICYQGYEDTLVACLDYLEQRHHAG